MTAKRINTPLLRRFGKTGLSFPEIGLGTWTFSGRDFGPIDDRECSRVFEHAVDAGIRFFDTADIYGRGRVENLLGEALSGLPVKTSSNLFIAGKAGNRFKGLEKSRKDFAPDYIEDALSESLERLKRPYLDLFQLHNPPHDVLTSGTLFEVLEQLRSKGRIRFIGISTVEKKDIELIVESRVVDAVQVPFNFFRQELLADCRSKLTQWGGAVIVRTPLEFGLLSGKLPGRDQLAPHDYRRKAWSDIEEENKRQAVSELTAILTGNNKRSLAQAALQFAILPSLVSLVIPGARNIRQLSENIRASRELPPLTLAELNDVDKVFRQLGLPGNASSFFENRQSLLVAAPPSDSPEVCRPTHGAVGNSLKEKNDDLLFTPLALGPLTLKNRLLRSGTTERCADENGHPDAHMAPMYKNLVKGGIGMLITGYVATAKDARASNSHCVINGKETAALWRQIVADARWSAAPSHTDETPAPGEGSPGEGGASFGGTPLCLQIAHGGNLSLLESGKRAGEDAIVTQFVKATEAAWDAGFDAVQVHAAHGYYLSQILGNASLGKQPCNPEGLRLLIRLIKAVKAVTDSNKKAVLVKLNMSDFLAGGFGPDGARIVAHHLGEIGVDAIEWSGWVPSAAFYDSPTRPGEINLCDEGFFVPFVTRLKKELPDMVMGCCGGFRSKEAMNKVLSDGLDFVSLSRALLAEPDLPHRLAEGRNRAYCNGCNACLAKNVRPIHCPVIHQLRRCEK
ncbi:MAG: hypothetical protein GY765_04125 [bacterium]|nr:hypothetical protein [bacterium]